MKLFRHLSAVLILLAAASAHAGSGNANHPCSALRQAHPAPILDTRQVRMWTQDLKVYRTQLERKHIDLYHQIERAQLMGELDTLQRSLPRMTEQEVLVSLMRLTRKIGDGHTAIPLWNRPACRFPLAFRLFAGAAYVVGTPADMPHLLGSKLVAINGIAADKVLYQLAQLVPFAENSYSIAQRTAEQLPNAELLAGLGISGLGHASEFVFAAGLRQYMIALTPSFQDRVERRLGIGGRQFSRPIAGDAGLWFASEDGGRSVYIGFRRYPKQPAMAAFGRRLMAYLNDRQSRNLIIDLRGNSGGDFFTGLMLAQSLVEADSIDWKSGVYVLTDQGTFSAAMSNAAQYSQILNARRVGQPTGGKPSGYQDMGQFVLPGSALVVTYSKRKYRFDAAGNDSLLPDVPIEASIDDYIKGDDRVIAWVLADVKKR